MSLLKSQRGKDLLFYNGYKYRRDRMSSHSETWRCPMKNCRGRLICRGEDKTEKTNHNHGPEPAEEEVTKAKNMLKELSKKTPMKPRAIIQASTSEVRSTEASIALPSYEACRKVVKRQRKEDANMSDTNSLSEVKTSKGHPFLLWDSSNDNKESRILMFGTQENLNLLTEFKNWSADGTFNVVPQAIFTQLFTIHIIVEKKAIPVLFILLENKQGGTYLRVFRKLKELNPNLSPNSILVDFEVGCFTKIKEVFPQADFVGCFFHLTQSLWRNIQRLGMVNIYKTSEKFRLDCKMLAALAYVPPKDVQFALEIISENFDEEMRPLVDYWERIYVEKRIEHVAPKFNIDMWNAFNRTINGLPITNNSLEAWHLSFQQSLGCFNPSLSKLLQQMKKEQNTTETYILKYRAGFRQSNAAHSKYSQKCKRITELLNDYVFRNVEQHLRAIAYNLSF